MGAANTQSDRSPRKNEKRFRIAGVVEDSTESTHRWSVDAHKTPSFEQRTHHRHPDLPQTSDLPHEYQGLPREERELANAADLVRSRLRGNNKGSDKENRRLEDVDYWRKRAGWYDDDESMNEYNEGVYDTYYAVDDDRAAAAAGGAGGGGGSKGAGNLGTFVKIGAIVVGIVILILIVRAIRRATDSTAEKKSRSKSSSGGSRSASRLRSESRSKRSGSRSRSKSLSRSRTSRSRSRSRRARSTGASSRRRDDASGTSGNYELMDDKSEGRSRRSSSRSRSRSKARSSDKERRASSRSRSKAKDEMLV